ncbi:hypothetical protein KJ909_02220 [Patescibacteria group bacterium]|nr:hypothetical protein [Patescibacteria group bacterium]
MSKIKIENGRFVVEGVDRAGLNGREMETVRMRRSPGQMRWKDGSYLTSQQVLDERWGMRDDREQQRRQSL